MARRRFIGSVAGLIALLTLRDPAVLSEGPKPSLSPAVADRPERASRSVGPNDERLVRLYAGSEYDNAGQRAAFIKIVQRESSFDHTAVNERNGRYGFAQALPENYEAAGVYDYRTNGVAQLDWMRDYILHRYGTPKEALRHHDERGWY